MGSLKKKSTEQGASAMSVDEPKTTGAKAVQAKPKKVPGKKASAPSAAATAVPSSVLPSTVAKRAVRKSAAKVTHQSEASTVATLEAPVKGSKTKLVRDSFTMPRDDFELIAKLKERALGFKQPIKKSELLRAGLHALQALSDSKLKAVLGGLTPLKAGRPKKQEA